VRHTQFLRLCAAAVAVLASAACSGGGEGGTTEVEEPLAPTYVLTSIDGTPAPLVVATHTYPSGVRQVYTMLFDSLAFTSPTALRRHIRAAVDSFEDSKPITPPLVSAYQYQGAVLRRGSRVIVEYANANGDLIKPDTFQLRGPDLVKRGPFGVSCAGCTPVRQVEYVYEPR
jgi:hypothetical protein